MDSQIYGLFLKADQEKKVDYIRQAYQVLNSHVSKNLETFSQHLCIECAEKAILFKEYEITDRCLKLYFSLPTISNQFLARAYLCQFELLAPKSTDQLEKFSESISFLFKAIEFSKQNKKYHFLIYNASVIYWKHARAFLKPNFKKFLCPSLKTITDALREVDDADFEWRLLLERTLIETYIDDKKLDDANSLASDLIIFIQSHLSSSVVDDFFEFLLTHNLLMDDYLRSLADSRWELTAIYRIEKLKKSGQSMNEEQISNEIEDVYKLLRPKNKFVRSHNDDAENKTNEFMKSFDYSKDDLATNQKRQKLLIKLARVCLIYDQVNLCSQIVGFLKESELANDESIIELEFIECEQTIKSLKHKQEKYTKAVVKQRVDNIARCQEALQNAVRLSSPRLIQLGCFAQWNLCLPLLQPSLRTRVRKPLQHVCECLDRIDSMEWLLRCRVHFELAKCDEELEQLQTAEQHLMKAISFDDDRIHVEQLEHDLKRLRLRAELYSTPSRSEDQAAMILEQCLVGGDGKGEKRLKLAVSELLESLNAAAEKSTPQLGQINTHSLLLRAADLLAPNDFKHVLDSETYKANFGKIGEDQVSLLHKKELNYENCVRKGVNHLDERLSDLERSFYRSNGPSEETTSRNSQELELILKADYKERLKLWFDLARIARKQQIWDICRVSCRFCILYDTQKYTDRFLKATNSAPPHSFGSLFDKDLMRNLAETHFIFGEALVQYIRGEGVELFEKPEPPVDIDSSSKSKHRVQIEQSSPKKGGGGHRDFNTDPEWKSYCQWLNALSKQAIDNFLRGIQIGMHLGESWLVSQGCSYVWNYLQHKIAAKKRLGESQRLVVTILAECLDALKKCGHNNEPELLVAVCEAFSVGLMQNWLPSEQVKSLQIPNIGGETVGATNEKQTTRKGNPTGNQQQVKSQFSLSAEAQADIRKALEACDYALNVTNGQNLNDLVNLKDRFPLIKTWVLAKQLAQSPIKNFGLAQTFYVHHMHNKGDVEHVQDKYTKCMVALEILNRNAKLAGLSASYEIKEAPTIRDVISFADAAQTWPDRLVELEIWSNLCVLSSSLVRTNHATNILRYCHGKALETLSYFEKRKTENK